MTQGSEWDKEIWRTRGWLENVTRGRSYQFRCLVNGGTMGVNSLPKTVIRQRRDCDLNPGPSAPESSKLTTRLLRNCCPFPYHLNFCCRIFPLSNFSLPIFPLPLVSVAVISYINFVLPCFLTLSFFLADFLVAQFSGCLFFLCRFFQLPFFPAAHFTAVVFTFYHWATRAVRFDMPQRCTTSVLPRKFQAKKNW